MCNNTVCDLEIEVQFVSGETVQCVQLPSSSRVSQVCDEICHARDVQTGLQRLLFGDRALNLDATLAAEGICGDVVLTLVVVPVSWQREHKGCAAEISQCGRIARRRFGCNDAVVVACAPARRFKVKVLSTKDRSTCKFAGGLELGFTTTLPGCNETAELPKMAAVMKHSWISGIVGSLFVDGKRLDAEIEWQPQNLDVGDVACVYTKKGGIFGIEVNGDSVLEWDAGIPDDIDLYPVSNIYGWTDAVELLSE